MGKAVLSQRGEIQAEQQISDDWDRNHLFLDCMKDFLDAVKKHESPRTPLNEGIDVLKIALAAKSSIHHERAINV